MKTRYLHTHTYINHS